MKTPVDNTRKALTRERKCFIFIIKIYCLLNRSKHVYGKQFYFDITKTHVGATKTILTRKKNIS